MFILFLLSFAFIFALIFVLFLSYFYKLLITCCRPIYDFYHSYSLCILYTYIYPLMLYFDIDISFSLIQLIKNKSYFSPLFPFSYKLYTRERSPKNNGNILLNGVFIYKCKTIMFYKTSFSDLV